MLTAAQLFNELDIKMDDAFEVSSSDGFVKAKVKRQNKTRKIVVMLTASGVESLPVDLSIEDRRKLMVGMFGSGLFTQCEIANLLGVSQATVSINLAK